jgi:small subunit ribosomal protein S6e
MAHRLDRTDSRSVYIHGKIAGAGMAQFKLAISDPKTTKAESKEVKDAEARLLLGKKIGEVVDASSLGLGLVMITGGSDKAGFPMRSDVLGGGKNYVLMTTGTGFNSTEGGAKKRRLVRGNTVTEEIYQVNLKKVEEKPKARQIAAEPRPKTKKS